MKRMNKAFLNGLAGLALVISLTSQATYAEVVADKMMVSNPVVRATPPGAENTAVYFTLYNTSDEAHQIVNVTSEEAIQVQLHTTLEKDGVYSMQRLTSVDVPAKKNTYFAPGGKHIMLMGLIESLSPGEHVPLTIIFEDGSYVRLSAEVKELDTKSHHVNH